MGSDPRLESYLASLEKALKPFPVSDRAEILTEIKSHVLSALDRDPSAQLDGILHALGAPETVANRFLLERGMQPTKPPISPMVKWIVVGFLGTVAMSLLFLGVLIFKFSPLIEVDERKDYVSLLGGLIEINGREGGRSLSGSAPLGSASSVIVRFGNAKLDVATAEGKELRWDCRLPRASGPLKLTEKDGALELDVSGFRHARCEISVPEGATARLQGSNGKLELAKPRFSVEASVSNGKIDFRAAEAAAYRFDVSVVNGRTDEFPSSSDPKAYSISLKATNGLITYEGGSRHE